MRGLGFRRKCQVLLWAAKGWRHTAWDLGLWVRTGSRLGFGIEGQVEAEDLELRKIALGIQGDLLVRVTVPSLTPDIPRP